MTFEEQIMPNEHIVTYEVTKLEAWWFLEVTSPYIEIWIINVLGKKANKQALESTCKGDIFLHISSKQSENTQYKGFQVVRVVGYLTFISIEFYNFISLFPSVLIEKIIRAGTPRLQSSNYQPRFLLTVITY